MKKILLTGFCLMPALIMIIALACDSKKDDEVLIWTDPPTAADTMYQNPIFEPDLADPTFIRATDETGNKWFYAYGTQNTWATGINRITPIVRSKNMVKWEYLGDAFTSTSKPSWHNGGIWAPQIVQNPNDGLFYLYYSNSLWGDSNPGVGVAKSQHPSGPFTDLGKVLDNQSSGVGNSIDQFFITTGTGRNKHSYLFWGSFAGIWGWEINATDMKTLIGSKFQIAGNGFEGTYIYEKDGVFWYFGSSGSCCDGPDTKYHLTVARATDIKGPYLDKNGNDIIQNGREATPFLKGDATKGWIGPGHNAEIIKDDKGRYFMLYHAVDVNKPWLISAGGATRRPLLMDEVLWDAVTGWPYIEGGVPSNTLKVAPYFAD
ncbi:MAG: family 43 glycosylhydrolase [Dysgonamonadaceae bacterium]|nr:family 43 glycosylhydrolase [Dysgonamonadaceae bacterium]